MASPIITSLDLVDDCRSPVPIHPLTVVGEGGWDDEQPYLYKDVLLHIFVGDITGIL